MRIVDPKCIPTPRADAARFRREAERAERECRWSDAEQYRALEAAADAQIAATEAACRARLARGGEG